MFAIKLNMTVYKPLKIDKLLAKEARKRYKTIVFPEAGFSDRIIEAAQIISKKKLAKVILIADESALAIRFKKLADVTIINPKTSELTQGLAQKLYEIRKEKGMTVEKANQLILDPFYFGTMLVKEGYADGMVAGAEVPTSQTLRPALEIIKTKTGLASSTMLFYGFHKKVATPFFVSDPGFVPNPTSEQLALIAGQTCQTLKQFFGEAMVPNVAFLSYSTKGSAQGEMVDKMSTAAKLFKDANPNINSDGELQLDAAIIPEVASKKCPDSPVGGRANVLIVPDLNVGNTLYKTMQYFGSLHAIGPIVQGLNKPINDLSRGCSVHDVVILTLITAIQCE
jgi:phosphate acetyltransferase